MQIQQGSLGPPLRRVLLGDYSFDPFDKSAGLSGNRRTFSAALGQLLSEGDFKRVAYASRNGIDTTDGGKSPRRKLLPKPLFLNFALMGESASADDEVFAQ
jgi:hypothetical protein